jgi:hypothetical protein
MLPYRCGRILRSYRLLNLWLTGYPMSRTAISPGALLATNGRPFRRGALKRRQKRHHAFKQAAFSIMGLLVTGLPALAQDTAAPATPKWRPKAGIYAVPGKDFENACGEFQGFIVELAESAISGSEWNCKISRLTDTAPGAIRLDMTCDDYNLAASLNEPEDKIFKEVMLLKKIDEKRIAFRKTVNGKFKYQEYPASYCPPDAQRAYLESKAQSKAEAGQKVMEEKLKQSPWRPQDGVYATSGTNLNDHCQKDGDAIIELSERSISIGSDMCSVTFIRDQPNEIRLFATCSQQPNAQGAIVWPGDRGSTLAPPSPETIVLNKIDDKTILVQKTKNGNSTDPPQKLSYCSEDVQKIRAQQKAAK